MKLIFIFVIGLLLVVSPLAIAQDADELSTITCSDDLKACEDLMAECAGVECEACEDCNKGLWRMLIKDRTLQATLIGSVILLVGGLAGIFITPPG